MENTIHVFFRLSLFLTLTFLFSCDSHQNVVPAPGAMPASTERYYELTVLRVNGRPTYGEKKIKQGNIISDLSKVYFESNSDKIVAYDRVGNNYMIYPYCTAVECRVVIVPVVQPAGPSEPKSTKY
jgi:hypothetical protein